MFEAETEAKEQPPTGRRLADRRAEATRAVIIEAAWRLSRRDGLTGWSLRQLAAEVGLAAPTLYAYFGSKHAIYDTMFEEGWEAFDAMAAGWDAVLDALPPRQAFKAAMAEFFTFCTVDPTRYQLMFQRVVPDFTPSEHAYTVSVASYDRSRRQLTRLGVTDPADVDLWTAISTGLTAQQLSNDPGGDRWARLLDTAVDLFCNHVGTPPGGDCT
jgi:AcrR family transcriptional regulator